MAVATVWVETVAGLPAVAFLVVLMEVVPAAKVAMMAVAEKVQESR